MSPGPAQFSPGSRAMIEGANTYFLVDVTRFQTAMARNMQITPAEAEKLAKTWLAQKAPGLQSAPKASEIRTWSGVPGSKYYIVNLTTTGVRVNLQEVLVLMDGTVIESELK